VVRGVGSAFMGYRNSLKEDMINGKYDYDEVELNDILIDTVKLEIEKHREFLRLMEAEVPTEQELWDYFNALHKKVVLLQSELNLIKETENQEF